MKTLSEILNKDVFVNEAGISFDDLLKQVKDNNNIKETASKERDAAYKKKTALESELLAKKFGEMIKGTDFHLDDNDSGWSKFRYTLPGPSRLTVRVSRDSWFEKDKHDGETYKNNISFSVDSESFKGGLITRLGSDSWSKIKKSINDHGYPSIDKAVENSVYTQQQFGKLMQNFEKLNFDDVAAAVNDANDLKAQELAAIEKSRPVSPLDLQDLGQPLLDDLFAKLSGKKVTIQHRKKSDIEHIKNSYADKAGKIFSGLGITNLYDIPYIMNIGSRYYKDISDGSAIAPLGWNEGALVPLTSITMAKPSKKNIRMSCEWQYTDLANFSWIAMPTKSASEHAIANSKKAEEIASKHLEDDANMISDQKEKAAFIDKNTSVWSKDKKYKWQTYADNATISFYDNNNGTIAIYSYNGKTWSRGIASYENNANKLKNPFSELFSLSVVVGYLLYFTDELKPYLDKVSS